MASNPEPYLISAVVRNGDFTTAAAAGISHDMFHAYEDEWRWIEKFYTKYRKTPTKLAFKRHFPDFPTKAVDDTAHFCDEVRKSHTRHMLMATMRETADLIADGDIDQAVAKMQGSMVTVAAQIGSANDTDILADYSGVLLEVEERKRRYDENGMAGIATGFPTLDERTGGVQPGQSWIFGARLGEFKSATLMRMATTAVLQGYTVQFAALEMSKAEVSMRVHNFLSGKIGKTIFQSLDLAQGRNFDLRAYREFLRGLKGTVKGQFHVSDSARMGALEIAAQVERNKPDIYFLDYLTLAKTSGDGGWLDIGKFSKDLKKIAREYGIGMVSAAQLNRENGTGKQMAGAEALAQSDAIGQDADAVVTMKKRSEHVVEYKLAKYRHGPSGYGWHAHVDYAKAIFDEVSYNKALDLIEKDKEAEAEARENDV